MTALTQRLREYPRLTPIAGFGIAAILLTGQQAIGGFTGLSDFRSFFGFRLSDPANRQMLFFIASGTLLVVVALIRQLNRSRYGELLVAVRDAE